MLRSSNRHTIKTNMIISWPQYRRYIGTLRSNSHGFTCRPSVTSLFYVRILWKVAVTTPLT